MTLFKVKTKNEEQLYGKVKPCWLSVAFVKSIVPHRMGEGQISTKKLKIKFLPFEKFLGSPGTGRLRCVAKIK